MIGKRGGIIYYFEYRQNKGRGEEHDPLAGFEPRTYVQHGPVIQEKKKGSLDHSATGHYIKPKD